MSTLSLFERDPILAAAPPKLRPYQTHAIQVLRDRVRDGKRRILLVAPTRSGKMTMMAAIIRTSSVPVLFVAHRMELIEQCVEQLARLGITNVGVMRGEDERTDPTASVQVASIQTLARRKKPPAGLVLIDECHRSASDSYQDLVFEYYKYAIIIGFTATPARYDSRPLGNLFECMEIVTTYAELIREGFIIAPECYGAPEDPDLSKVRIAGSDFDEAALGEVMRKQKLIGNLLDHWLKLANKYLRPDGMPGLVEGPRRRTIIFAAGIQHSLDICERFDKAGVRIAHLDGETPENDRRRIIKALGDGELEVVSNCNILLEGVDIPPAKCVVHARPTQSLVLWRQSSSRILTPWHPGCPPGCVAHPSVVPLLLDHAGNIARNYCFPHEDLHWELHKKAQRVENRQNAKICKMCFAYVPVARVLCPYCGTEFPPAPKLPSPQETQDQLVRRSSTPEAMQRAFYDDMVQAARKKGHKPGFPSVKFKEHYGVWPPWAWSEATRASFASDQEWQQNYETKQTRNERKIKENAEWAAPPTPEVDLDDALEDPQTPTEEAGVSEEQHAAEMAVSTGNDEDPTIGTDFDDWLHGEIG
jgi:DNA repair protein RadD